MNFGHVIGRMTWPGRLPGRGTMLPAGPASLDRARHHVERVQLRDKLRKIEALFAGAGTEGEKLAAGAALDRVRARLAELNRSDPPVELKFSIADQWSRQLFLALSRRYGLRPFRYSRQRRTTVMLRVPRRFLDTILWPEFEELSAALLTYLHEVTQRVIRDEVYADTSEAGEVKEALSGR